MRLRGATQWLHEGIRRVGSLFKKLAAQVNHGAQIKVCCLRETFCQAASGRLFSACVAESTERGLAGWCIVCCLLRGNKRARDSLDGLCTVEIDEAAAAAGGIAHAAAAAAAAVLMYKREREAIQRPVRDLLDGAICAQRESAFPSTPGIKSQGGAGSLCCAATDERMDGILWCPFSSLSLGALRPPSTNEC